MGNEITSTTVVGVLGLDDLAAFEAFLADVSDEFELDARVRMNVGSYAVRFSRRPAADVAPSAAAGATRRRARSAAGSDGLLGRVRRFLDSRTSARLPEENAEL